jgi:fermentation-respiration switch protein FrsA (DUF1100 family)
MRILYFFLFGYLAYCMLVYVMQRQMMFPRALIETPLEKNNDIAGMEKLMLSTGYGQVEAWFLPPGKDNGKKPAPAVIFAHGNGELIDFWPRELAMFAQMGLGLLLVEYPGYGRSEGSPSQKSIAATFAKAYDILTERADVDGAKIVLMGRSIGGGAVCTLIPAKPAAALILLSTFKSAKSFAPRYLVPGFLVKDPFDNLAAVRAYRGLVLVIHGRHDDLIPYSHGKALAGAATNGRLITYDCAHNDCPPSWPIFWRDIKQFLDEAL